MFGVLIRRLPRVRTQIRPLVPERPAPWCRRYPPELLGKLREATALPAHLAALPDANGDMPLSIINALGRINGCP